MSPARLCPLCERPLGQRVEDHHLVPRTYRGRETVPLHPICHRKIHTVLTERELKDQFHTIETLRAHPAVAAFVKWLANKPPDFHERTATSRALKDKRGRR